VISRDTPSAEHFKAGVACSMPFGPAHRHPGLPQVRRKTMSEPRIMELVADMFCISDTQTGIR
jgi:hypothetical protein